MVKSSPPKPEKNVQVVHAPPLSCELDCCETPMPVELEAHMGLAKVICVKCFQSSFKKKLILWKDYP